MSRGKTIRPSYYDEEESSQDELSHTLSKGPSNIGSQSDDEEMSKISFGALNRAQTKLNKHNQKHKTQEDNYKSSEEEFFDSDSDSDGPPEETSSKDTKRRKTNMLHQNPLPKDQFQG